MGHPGDPESLLWTKDRGTAIRQTAAMRLQSSILARSLAVLLLAVPLSGCLASALGSMAATALLGATGSGGPEPTPTVGEQLATLDPAVRQSCAAQLPKEKDAETEQAEKAAGEGMPNDPNEPENTTTPASSTPEHPPRCAVKDVCLPGYSKPVAMMVCQNPEGDDLQVRDLPPAPKSPWPNDWDWQPAQEASAPSSTRGTSL